MSKLGQQAIRDHAKAMPSTVLFNQSKTTFNKIGRQGARLEHKAVDAARAGIDTQLAGVTKNMNQLLKQISSAGKRNDLHKILKLSVLLASKNALLSDLLHRRSELLGDTPSGSEQAIEFSLAQDEVISGKR